ncbi:MAG: c-type cytochrome [Acidobacteriota bacterium]
MNSHAKTSRIKLLTVLIAISLFAACSKDSVVSNNTGQQNAATTGASPAPADANNSAASPQPGAAAGGTPATSPTSPVGPVGQTTPTSPLDVQPGEKKQMMGNLPVTVGPAKPALTPAPDPFPPRPTPSVVVQNGKVVQQWQAPADVASMTNPVKDRPDAVKIGREFYMQKCVDCHGKEGKGNGYMSKMVAKPPTNLASQMVQANSDGELFWKVTNGKSPMPAHRVRFDDEQRWYIVTYLRTFKP